MNTKERVGGRVLAASLVSPSPCLLFVLLTIGIFAAYKNFEHEITEEGEKRIRR
jgi:hypothetical protein